MSQYARKVYGLRHDRYGLRNHYCRDYGGAILCMADVLRVGHSLESKGSRENYPRNRSLVSPSDAVEMAMAQVRWVRRSCQRRRRARQLAFSVSGCLPSIIAVAASLARSCASSLLMCPLCARYIRTFTQSVYRRHAVAGDTDYSEAVVLPPAVLFLTAL